MSVSLGIELWDKGDSITAFNESNTIIVDKFQKIMSDFCKSQLTNTCAQKRLFEKFLSENDSLKKSEFSFATNIYFLAEQIYNMMNAQEAFCSAFLGEVDEVIKNKSINIKKDSRTLKLEKKILSDDLTKENQKLDIEFKKYRTRYTAKDVAHLAFVKAEENKALSRNQVDSYHSTYTSKQALYNESKSEYQTALEHYNKYQSNYYSSSLGDWGSRAQAIENERYDALRATFRTLSELCKTMASKFNDLANEIEFGAETIECEKDCQTLVNKEKTGDVPPRDVPFKDFEVQEKVEVCASERPSSKLSSSGSDSTSSNSGHKKNSITEIVKLSTSLTRSETGSINKENIVTSNGEVAPTAGFFGRLFGGSKKSKEVTEANIQSEIEHLESLLEEKSAQSGPYEINDEADQEIDEIKQHIETLKNDKSERKLSEPQTSNKLNIFQSLRRKNSRNKSIDGSSNSVQESSLIRSSRGSNRSQDEKRRSRSVSASMAFSEEPTDDKDQKSLPSKNESKLKCSKPKLALKPKMRGKKTEANNRERLGTEGINSRSIDVIRNVGPVEIVSTPAEALAIVSKSNSVMMSDQDCYTEISNDDIENVEIVAPRESKIIYNYFYVGSCVAIHEYTSTDSSNIYISFNIGEQFYIIQEDECSENSGWLLVERIDRSQSGFVPASYMDTRQFDEPVLMHSDRPILMA